MITVAAQVSVQNVVHLQVAELLGFILEAVRAQQLVECRLVSVAHDQGAPVQLDP